MLIYIDKSQVREGAREELKPALEELARFVEANEPAILAYNVYLSDDGTRMSVVHIHRDSASLEFHMEVAGPAFRRFVDLVNLSSIEIYGEPSATALSQLQEKKRACWVAAASSSTNTTPASAASNPRLPAAACRPVGAMVAGRG